MNTPCGPISWVLTIDDLRHLLAAATTATVAVIDLETTGLREHAVRGGPLNGGYPARIVLASITLEQVDEDEPTTWVLPLSHPDGPWRGRWRKVATLLCRTLLEHRIPIVNQHVKFDAKWLHAHTGVDLSSQITWCTQVSSHMLDETNSTSLKERAPLTFGIERWDDDVDLTYPGAAESTDIFDLGEYAARDTYWTWRLYRHHRVAMYLEGDDPLTPDEIVDARLGRLMTWCAMPAVATMTEVEQRGFRLDVDWVREQHEQHRREIARGLDQMSAWYGMDRASASTASTSKWFIEFTERALAADDLVVGGLTPNGNPQWSKGVLLRQARSGSDVAALVLATRGHVKMAEYLGSWLDHVAPDGRIHATYHVGRVVTGRLSSADPNMQQVTKALRPAFIPSPGHVILDLDFSQIELRVAAFIARCAPMIAAFQHGEDLHRLLAQQIVQRRVDAQVRRGQGVHRTVTLDDVLPEERQAGKSANFGLLYGMSPMGFLEYAETVYDVTLTPEEAQDVHRAFFATWEGMADWHARTVLRAKRTGLVISPLGRVRRLPDIWDGNPGVAGRAERAAINAPVQGMASDLMQIAAASIAGKMPGHERVGGAALLGTVHDSIVVEAPQDSWVLVAEECQMRMTKTVLEVLARLECRFDVPLVADVTAGTRWGLNDVVR